MARRLLQLAVILAAGVLVAVPAMSQGVDGATDAVARPAPFLLDGDDSFDYDQGGRLDLGPSGTIEFHVAALWDEDPGYLPCVLSSARPAGGLDSVALQKASRYSIYIDAERSEIGMWNGQLWASVPFDFSDGQFHHVAFVTDDGETEVLIDGEAQGLLEFGYGSGTGLPLHVGSSDGVSDFFGGALQSVRLWDEALPDEMLEELALVYGPPDADHEAAELLLAFSHFTDQDQQIFIASEKRVQSRGAISAKLKQKIREKREANKAKRAKKRQGKKAERQEKRDARKEVSGAKRDRLREDVRADVKLAGNAIKARVKKFLRPPPPLAPPQSDPPPVRRRARETATAQNSTRVSSAPAPPRPRLYRRLVQAFHPALASADGNAAAADRARQSRRRLKLVANPPGPANIDGNRIARNLSSLNGRFQSAARQN